MSPGLIIGLVVAGLVILFLVLGPLQSYLERKKVTASTCGDVPHPGGTNDPQAWFIGPVLDPSLGGDHSPGMPLHPSASSDGRLTFDFPVGDNVALGLGNGPKVDYVTFRHGPLTGKKLIRLRYNLELLDPSAEILAVPEQDPSLKFKARITPIFIEDGDDWQADGKFEAYRWYHEDADLDYLQPGQHEVVAPLDSGWTATVSSSEQGNPAGFKGAIDNCCCVGFVLGGNEVGIGHGARATAPARLTYSITVE